MVSLALYSDPLFDDRTTDMFLRGFDDFNSLSNVEKMRFSVIMQRLINTHISSVRMDSKSLVDSQEVAILGDICLAMILTPGGRQWWNIIGPYFTVHDQINERIEKDGDTFPSWTEMVPFCRPDGRASGPWSGPALTRIHELEPDFDDHLDDIAPAG